MDHFQSKIVALFIFLILLSSCGLTDKQKVPTPESSSREEILEAVSKLNIIVAISENSILIGSIYYKIDDNTKILNADNKKITFEELQVGDLVFFEDEGHVMESFPGQGFATSVILQNDAESLKVSKSIKYLIEHQKTGNILNVSIEEWTNELITLHFNEWEIHGKKYEAKIDPSTNEYNVKEIVNEEAVEREKRNKEMAAAHPEGSTAGHITEVYADGFRINMVDYKFANDIQFNTDMGNKLTKNQFPVGSFVSVNYDKMDSTSTVGKGILSELTLITKEANPEVREWIEFIIEGDLYQEPVIMQSYSDQFQTYYAIIIADLKDDTWDTFELKYDLKLKTYTTTTRIAN